MGHANTHLGRCIWNTVCLVMSAHVALAARRDRLVASGRVVCLAACTHQTPGPSPYLVRHALQSPMGTAPLSGKSWNVGTLMSHAWCVVEHVSTPSRVVMT